MQCVGKGEAKEEEQQEAEKERADGFSAGFQPKVENPTCRVAKLRDAILHDEATSKMIFLA